MRLDSGHLYDIWRSRFGDRPVGHDHFWERSFSRRRFIGSALASGAVLALPAVAEARDDMAMPDPIKGGTVLPFKTTPRPFYFPTPNTPMGIAVNNVQDHTGDPSMIRNFKGIVGLAEFPPAGVVTGDPKDGHVWAGDLRFMQGQFIDRTGHLHSGTLAFI